MRERVATTALALFVIAVSIGSFIEWGLGAAMISFGLAALIVSYFLGSEG